MYRVDSPWDASDIEAVAGLLKARLAWARGRCEHGYTREETCRDCENGYVDDIHTYAWTKGEVASLPGIDRLIGVTDDGMDVAYIPIRYQRRVEARQREVEALLEQREAEERQAIAAMLQRRESNG